MNNYNINKSDHAILLLLLDELPIEEAFVLRQELNAIYSDYLVQLDHLQKATGSYELIAAKVRSKSSVRKRAIKSRLMEQPVVAD